MNYQASQVDSSLYRTPTMAVRQLRDYTVHVVGIVKTIIDAVIVDPKQNKATKDLIHQAIWFDSYTQATDWAAKELKRQTDGSDNKLSNIFPFSREGVEELGDQT